tara:strand:+ start:1687 stop:2643 length:957 start_codon:yes stop_codon:yes gene_type:complete
MSKPFIIAEVGSNFDQSLNKAKKYIEVSKKSGANAVKFQLFSGKVLYPNNLKMQKIFELIELRLDWIEKLLRHANKTKIKIIFSCFDNFRQKIINEKGIVMHKIASSEISNFDLFTLLNKKKYKVFLSTGMSDLDDIKIAYKKLNKCELVIMQCTSLYPTNENDVNLNVINTFKKNFKKAQLGLSDHTTSDVAAIASVGMGVRYFEKHITLNKNSNGPDHFYAYEPLEFAKYVENINNAYKCLGSNIKTINPSVRKVARLTGVYSNTALEKGKILKKNDIILKSPAIGVREKEINLILGKKLKFNIKKNKPLKFNYFI